MRSRGTILDYVLLTALASAASVVSFLHYFRRQEILLIGDAVAHLNIARRVFDSLTPGPLQLGTVWLPLPHVLAMPFVVSGCMWRTGVGGSIVSMAAYVLATVGVYRLVRRVRVSRAAAWLGAAIYGANPNLLYFQATAMTESLYAALFIWVVAAAVEFDQALRSQPARAPRRLESCALLLAAAILTRYDGWFLAASVTVGFLILWLRLRLWWRRPVVAATSPRLGRAARNFILLLAVVPGLWLAYNYREFGNPTEFATGPYSARSIERRAANPYDPHHPGWDSPPVAAEYFLKAAKLQLGAGPWELPLFLAALAGTALMLGWARGAALLLLLWVPLPFYVLSIAYAYVPVFLPGWWPFSYYNARYGLQLLPAVAVFAALAFGLLAQRLRSRWWHVALALVAAVMVAGSYASVWRTTPICLREARANGSGRQDFEIALARELEKLPPSSRLLISTGDHPGALQRAGIALRRTINETNHPQWEQALRAPAQQADYIIAFDHDDVAEAVASHPEGLERLAVLNLPGQPRTTLYKSLPRAR